MMGLAMANPSLTALLTAVERWQRADRSRLPAKLEVADAALQALNPSALRAAAHQHAEALRDMIVMAGADVTTVDDDRRLRAAADFLDGGSSEG